MGFRCPNCNKDFDKDMGALNKHFKESEECKKQNQKIIQERVNSDLQKLKQIEKLKEDSA